MKIVTIIGVPWKCHSPSSFEMVAAPVTLAFTGSAWCLSMNGARRDFPSKDEAIKTVEWHRAILDKSCHNQDSIKEGTIE